jgi:ankyrin repeat protein
MFVRRLIVSILLIAICYPLSASGHETDQFSVPAGREFADLRFYYSHEIYKRLESVLEKTNSRIKKSLHSVSKDSLTENANVNYAKSDMAIARAMYAEFPSFIYHIHYCEYKLNSNRVKRQFPGLVVSYMPLFWIYDDWALTLDITKIVRLVRTSTIMINGTYLGVDKLSHFFDMGYVYYLSFKRNREKGLSDAEAASRSVSLSAGLNPLFSESTLLGSLTTGIRSNADLAANYVGMKFYQNLTEAVRIKGQIRPPMLVRDGHYWRFNDHVRANADFFSMFISDHFNEALNPNTYILWIGKVIQRKLSNRCDDLLKWYTNNHGNPKSREQFETINRELSTYYGEDYGHSGIKDDMVSIAKVCFDKQKPSIIAKPHSMGNTALIQKAGMDPSASNHPASVNEPAGINVSEGIVINAADKSGRTDLWRAVRKGNIDGVKKLIRLGADINAADLDGEVPLHVAARWGRADIAEILLSHGANANTASMYGMTPLHLAVREMQNNVINVLLYHGADTNARDMFGLTPLHDIAVKGDAGLVSLLIDAGADPAVQDINGSTALHRAVRSENAEVVMKLLELGSNATVQNIMGKTPLDEALQAGNDTIIKYFASKEVF